MKEFPEDHTRVFPPEKTDPDPVKSGHPLLELGRDSVRPQGGPLESATTKVNGEGDHHEEAPPSRVAEIG